MAARGLQLEASPDLDSLMKAISDDTMRREQTLGRRKVGVETLGLNFFNGGVP